MNPDSNARVSNTQQIIKLDKILLAKDDLN